MSNCFHGGSFWQEIGPRFDRLDLSPTVVNADVLDAWFPPAPGVVEALSSQMDWIARTSPPTHAEGLTQEISDRLGVSEESILVGPGSSHFIFTVLRGWLKPGSRVLLLEPTYGEYSHVAELAGCEIDRFTLLAKDNFYFDIPAWASRAASGNYDLVVLVNPNNPSGGVVSREALTEAISGIPISTKIWIDEAYLDYTSERTFAQVAANRPNVYVVKSLSKGLALSGLRVAYLIGPNDAIADLRRWSPPWNVSLPAQIAAVIGLRDCAYYDQKYRETSELRSTLARDLQLLGPCVMQGEGNWVLCRLPSEFPSAAQVVESCAAKGIYLRDAGRTAPSLGDRYVRIAVKPIADQVRIIEALEQARLHR